jgi:hypothetical protein
VSDFARPIKRLAESGIGVAAAPTGGMGLALDDKGLVPALALVERWHVVGTAGEPAFENSWVNLDGGTSSRPARFRKDASGWVVVEGVVASGTSISTSIFTLPPGYRHDAVGNMIFPAVSNSLFGSVYVTTGGVVTGFVGSTVYITLNIGFYAAA